MSGDADPAARNAVLDTLEVFFRWMNKDTEGDTRNPSFSPYYRSEFMGAYLVRLDPAAKSGARPVTDWIVP